MKRNIFMIGICILLFAIPITAWLINDRSNKQLYEDTFISMDTPMKLSAYGPKAKVVVDESKKKVDELNEMASPTIATSDVSKINRTAGRNYVKVHPEIIKMLVLSQKYSKISKDRKSVV